MTLIDVAPQSRPLWRSIRRGLSCRCPRCGIGALFRGFLTVHEQCPACSEALHHQRADDAPPYFIIMIVGHIVVGLALSVEVTYRPPMWAHAALWLPLTLVLACSLLRPVKGAVIGLQWAHFMHGFGSDNHHQIGD